MRKLAPLQNIPNSWHRNLRDTDVFSKSDPICIVYHQPFGSKGWSELKRTECIDNTLNPDFATKILLTYHFEEQQNLKFRLFDIDSGSSSLEDHDFLGEFECTLGFLVSSQKVEKPLRNEEYSSSDNGTIIIVTEEVSSSKEEINLQLMGKNLENRSWFCALDPFLEFYKANEDGSYTLVHRSETVRSTKNPTWKEFTLPLSTLCSGDYDRNIQVICKNFKSSGSHKVIGVFYTSVRKLREGPVETNVYTLQNEDRRVRHSWLILIWQIISLRCGWLTFLHQGSDLQTKFMCRFT